jgi:O-antigen/teichoic acid export membrane protein
VSFKGLILLVCLIYRGEISLRPRLNFLDKKLKKEMKNVAVFSIIAGMGSMLVFNIDKIVINQLLDLKSTGVYTIAFFFGTLVVIPSRPLLRISLALIADAWAKSDTDKIKEIYYKSCINQFLIGGFLFLGIWANIDNIITILGPQYVESKWVIFFIGLGYLIDMMTGANGLILDLSKYYRISLVFIFILILLVVGLLYLLIPIWGIVGAAIAITLALLLNNFLRFIFLYHKYQMQPFDYKFIVVMLFFIGLYFAISVIPQQQMVLDILIRGSIITVSFILFVIVVPVADDIKAILLKMGKKFL